MTKQDILNKQSHCEGKCWRYYTCRVAIMACEESEKALGLVNHATRCANNNVEKNEKRN